MPSVTNISFDVYPGYNAAKPYPDNTVAPKLQSVRGYMRHHVKAGGFGYQMPQPIFWTHNLYVPLGTNIQDAYKTQLGIGAVSQGDTILVSDYPLPGRCQAFLVVLIQVLDRGTPNMQLRIFLDRAQPSLNPCPKRKRIQSRCCNNQDLPDVLYATIVGAGPCACANGLSTPLIWDPTFNVDNSRGGWLGQIDFSPCGAALPLGLYFVCTDAATEYGLGTTGCIVNSPFPPQFLSWAQCDPLNYHFQIAPGGDCCGGSISGFDIYVTE